MIWVSIIFSDSNKPAGQRTLGVAVVEVPDSESSESVVVAASLRATQLNINPGVYMCTVAAFDKPDLADE